MAISKIQQSQISGSLSFDDSLAAGSSLASKSTLKGDLDALRSQINKIVGKSNWYDALDGSQDLSDIYAAVHMSGANADFQGTVDVTGAATLDSTLAVAGSADFNGGVTANEIKIDGDTAQRLYIVDADGSMKDEGNLIYDGSKLDITGNLDVSGFADIAGALDVGGIATFDAAISGSAGLEISAGGASIVGGAAITGDLTVSEDFAALGNADIMGVLDAGSLYVAGAAEVSGSFVLAGAADLNSTLDVAGAASLSSTLDVAGLASLDGGIDVDGAFTVADGSGNVATSGTLDVDGAVDFDSTLDVAGAVTMQSTLGVTGAATLSSTLDVSGLASLDGGIDVDGAFTVADSSGNVATTGTLDVDGAVDFDSTLDVAGAAVFQSSLDVDGAVDFDSTLDVAGAATFGGGVVINTSPLDVNADLTANKISIDGDTAQRLYIVDADGSMKDEANLMYDGSKLDIIGNLRVSGDAQVDGDLLVKGNFTYIETSNMRVKDAFIYLATGSAGNVDSGIVLSKGAGASHDLIVGQDGGAGELIFARVAHNAAGDSPADLNGAQLVSAWMGAVQLGGMEGSLSGSLAASATGVSLTSSANMGIAAMSNLSLGANGQQIGLMSGAEFTAFDAAFDATSIVGALNELRSDLDLANAGGNLSKETYDAADFVGNVLSFSGQGTLASADHKLVDVYLNGVLMAKDRDLTAISTTSVTFDSSIVSALVAEDVITVIVRG